MYGYEYDVRQEQLNDLKRDAANERLAREVRQNTNARPLNNVRHTLGRGLVQMGQHLLNDR